MKLKGIALFIFITGLSFAQNTKPLAPWGATPEQVRSRLGILKPQSSSYDGSGKNLLEMYDPIGDGTFFRFYIYSISGLWQILDYYYFADFSDLAEDLTSIYGKPDAITVGGEGLSWTRKTKSKELGPIREIIKATGGEILIVTISAYWDMEEE